MSYSVLRQGRFKPHHSTTLMTNDRDAPNESTRLLPGDDEEAVSPGSPTQSPNTKPVSTPLPKAQLGALVAVRIVDPIAYMQIFPYINQLLTDLKIAEPERVGFYSGLVVRVDCFRVDSRVCLLRILLVCARANHRRAHTRSHRCSLCTNGDGYQVSS